MEPDLMDKETIQYDCFRGCAVVHGAAEGKVVMYLIGDHGDPVPPAYRKGDLT